MFGMTPNYKAKLFKAIEIDKLDRVKEYLEHVPIDVRYDGGVNLIRLCVENESIKSLAYILEQGCDPNIKTNIGQAPIVFAASYWNVESVKLLIKYKADVDVYGINGTNPLLEAAGRGRLDIVMALLIEGKANVNAISKSGETAEDIARMSREQHVAEYLKQYRETQEKPLLLQHKEEIVKPNESNDNSVRHYWTVTDHQEITRTADKGEINKRITQIFNFEAQAVLTIIENTNSKAENVIKENFENVAPNLIETACSTYEEKTGENVVSLNKQAQPWNNLNKDKSRPN